jgi:uncharacterized protein (TIGR02246 family)
MRSSRLAAAVVAALALPALAGAQGKTDPLLDKLNTEFMAAFNAKDAARLASFYTEDASLMPPNQPLVKGRPNIEAYWRGAFEQGVANLQLKPVESAISGAMGFEAGTATVTVKTPGGVIKDTSKYVVVFRRTDTGWKMAYDIYNSDAPPPGSK